MSTRIRAELALELPFSRLERVLLAGPAAWVPSLEEDRDGRLVTEVGVGSGRTWIGRRVSLHVGEPAAAPGRCTVPISWSAESHPELFPVLGGVLELTPVSPARTLVALEATYDAPAGAVGELADRAVLHRVADATVRGFLERAAWVLERAAGAQVPPPAG